MADIVKTRNISFVVFSVGFLLFLIGFSAPDWVQYTDKDTGQYYHEGLWRKCWDIGVGKNCRTHDPVYTGSKLKATQANMCLSLILLVGAIAGYIFWFMQKASDIRQRGMTDVGRVTLYLSASGGCFNFLAILIYGFYWVGYGEYLQWAYALSVVSAIIFTFCGFTAVCLVDFGPKSSRRNTTTTTSATGYPASIGPTVQAVFPPTDGAPVYFMTQNTGQPINVVYQPGLGYNQDQPSFGQSPPYSANQPPPTYQPEWQTKGANTVDQGPGTAMATAATDSLQINTCVGNVNLAAECGDLGSPNPDLGSPNPDLGSPYPEMGSPNPVLGSPDPLYEQIGVTHT